MNFFLLTFFLKFFLPIMFIRTNQSTNQKTNSALFYYYLYSSLYKYTNINNDKTQLETSKLSFTKSKHLKTINIQQNKTNHHNNPKKRYRPFHLPMSKLRVTLWNDNPEIPIVITWSIAGQNYRNLRKKKKIQKLK